MSKRITDEQDQGDIGELQVHEQFIRLGWRPRPLKPDLGEDFIIDVYDEGVSAGLAFYAQVKSSSNLSKFELKNGNYSYPIEVKDLNHWRDYFPPVVLIIWDTGQRRGYWSAIADIAEDLDKKRPGWQERKRTTKGQEPTVNVLVPQINNLDAAILGNLRYKVGSLLLPSVIKGKKLEMSLRFSFPYSTRGQEQQESMKRFVDLGEGVIIDGEFIEGIRMSDWYERKFGKPTITNGLQLSIGPRNSDQVEKIRLTLLSPQGRAQQVELVEVRAVLVGNKQITFTNEHFPSPFSFRMVTRKDGFCSINVSLKGTKTTAGEALRACSFFENAHDGGTLRLDVLTNQDRWGNWSRVELPIHRDAFPEVDPIYRRLLGQLDLIEQKTGVTFALTHAGIRQDDVAFVNEVVEILTSGRHTVSFDKQTQTLNGAKDADGCRVTIDSFLESWRRDEPIFIKAQTQEVYANVLGTEVPLGEQRMQLTGKLEPSCAMQLEALAKSKTLPKDLEFVLLDGTYAQEFPEWMNSPVTLPALSLD